MKMILDKPSLPRSNSQTPIANPVRNWDTLAVARLIRENSTAETSPAFLYLGRIETRLLREHLAEAFGAASVITLNETYYMGLKVISVDLLSYLQTGGSKIIRSAYLPSLRNAS
ncbi:MAG: hypothetical protein V4727_09035 [Verrucomicrobiota bacterium]